MSELLAPDEPGAYRIVEGGGTSPYFLICDHANRSIPRSLGTLGLSEADLRAHIAWDIGAAGLAVELAERLGAFLILQNYSRLVIDCNRPLDAPDSIAKKSEGIVIPGNQSVSSAEAALRAESIYHPYHGRIRSELDRRDAEGRETVIVTVHSFTPVYFGQARPWHAGVLYQRDARLAHALLELLRREPDLVIGDNEPYRVTDRSDVAVVEYGERRSKLHVEIEVRQDLIADTGGQRLWADRLARVLEAAYALVER